MEPKENAGVFDLEHIILIDNHDKISDKDTACIDKVKGFSTPNAGGELYTPTGIEEVRARAAAAGKRYFDVFGTDV